MLKQIGAKIEKANVVNFAAVACIFLFVVLGVFGLVIVVVQPDALTGWKEVYVVIMPTITAVFVAYGIVLKKE